MSNHETLWGVLSLLLTTYQYVPYFKGIFSGRIKPHAFSWLVWALPGVVVCCAQISKGEGAGSWAAGYSGLLCFIVFILSLTRGEKGITPMDWVMLFCGLAAIAAWLVTDDPLGAVLLSSLATGLAFIPTIRKSRMKPYSESMTTYVVSSIKWITAIAALKSLTLTTLFFPVTSMAMGLGFAAWMEHRRRLLNAAEPEPLDHVAP